MDRKKIVSLKDENKYRADMRKALLTFGTPIMFVLLLCALLVVNTILTTFQAEKDFKTVDDPSQLVEVQKYVNKSAYTSTFMEGYKATYNYATALAPQDPETAVMIYMTDVIPVSPPEFVCYPITNGYHYTKLLGDKYAEIGDYLYAEVWYNNAEHFLMTAPHCFSGGGGGGGGTAESQGSESGEGEEQSKSEGEEQTESEYQKAQDELNEKRNEARESQGKDPIDDSEQSDGPASEEQQQQNQENTNNSEQTQRDTESARDAERKGEYNTRPVEQPW